MSPPFPAPVPAAAAYTSDGDNMLRAVLERPEDDAPRVQYADWLDERGWAGDAERAEFIRVQVELARLEWAVKEAGHLDRVAAAIAAPKRAVLRRRERDLLFADPAKRNWLHWSGSPIGDYQAFAIHENNAVRFAYFGRLLLDETQALEVRFARGFVASVALPTAVFVGRPCQRCGGSLNEDSQHIIGDRLPCRACMCDLCRADPQFRASGMCKQCSPGRTPGLAAALFAAHPVAEVRLTDREPHEWRGRFFWYDDQREGGTALAEHYLPEAIYKLIDWAFDLTTEMPESSLRSAEAAHAALSRACVVWGREQAGLTSPTHPRSWAPRCWVAAPRSSS